MDLELKYIWIGEYRVLEKFEFNFCHSGEHTFSFNGSIIKLNANAKAPLDFGTNVSSITAIVGKNGSGKSSFCEIVLSSVATLQNGSFGNNIIFDGIVCYGDTIFIQNKLKIKNLDEISAAGYIIVRFENSPFEEMLHEWRTTYVKDGFIYYSNYIDSRNLQEENNLTNISTSKLLSYDWGCPYPIPPSKHHRSYHNYQDFYSQFESFSVQENFRFLRFILDFPEFSPFVSDHIHVLFDLTYGGNNKFIYNADYSEVTQLLNNYENEILSAIEGFDREDLKKLAKVDQNEFKNLSHKFYKLNLLNMIVKNDNITIDSNLVREFLYENKIPDFFKEEVAELLTAHTELLTSGHYFDEYSPSIFHSWYENTNDWRFYVLHRISIPFTLENRSIFKRFIELEEIVIGSEKYSDRRISNYHLIPHFSSGEASYLSLFSRINDTIRKNIKGIDKREKLILFIDEAEVGFHPDWSKALIKKLIDFLNSSFNPFKIQLILTTHSPYLLSDLPKYNVRQFYKEPNGHPELITSSEETFGSNIYDLLSDSFFMENGFIGDFAQEQIDLCFDLLNSNELISLKNKEFIEKIINIIGEPLIKRQLVQLYDEKFKTQKELDFIDEQIEKLKKLRAEKNKND